MVLTTMELYPLDSNFYSGQDTHGQKYRLLVTLGPRFCETMTYILFLLLLRLQIIAAIMMAARMVITPTIIPRSSRFNPCGKENI